MALSSVSTETTDDQRPTGCLMISKRSASNPSQPVVVPVRPASRFHPTILNNLLSISSPPCTKMSLSYPAGLGPHCGHMFASARSCRPTSSAATCTLDLTYPQPTGDGSLTVRPNQVPTKSPKLWKRWTSLNCREMNANVNGSVLRRTFSCNHEGTTYGCSFSPLFVHTLAFSTSMIPGTRCNTSTVHGSTYPPCNSSCPDLAQDTTTSKASNDSHAFLETEADSSSHSKNNCLATEARVHHCIPTSTGTGSTKDSDIESDPINDSGDRKSFCGDYNEVEGDVESGVTYFFECESESDDEIVFSNEPDSTGSFSCQSKTPSQCLTSLESGFGEISYTESCDSEWDDDQQGSESGTDSDRILNTCDYHSLPDPVPAFSSTSLVHSRFQESASTAESKYSVLKHSQIMKRLSMSRVCGQRHRNCLPSTHNHIRTTPFHQKKVSFLPDSELLEVHHIVVWNYAHRSCRKGPWEQYARDRVHFQSRIDRVRSIIEPCLQKKLKCMSAHSSH